MSLPMWEDVTRDFRLYIRNGSRFVNILEVYIDGYMRQIYGSMNNDGYTNYHVKIVEYVYEALCASCCICATGEYW